MIPIFSSAAMAIDDSDDAMNLVRLMNELEWIVGPADALARLEGGTASPTSSASLRRDGSATICRSSPSNSVSRGAQARAVHLGQAEPCRGPV